MSIDNAASHAQQARDRMAQVVQGHRDAITTLLVALASGGHVLLEGMPGVGKTTIANTFAKVTGLSFRRIQLTPDLMPADITGHTFYNQATHRFELRKGPIFTNILLADELNRTPPRTQAALLEVMQEQQATIDGETHAIDAPFLVIATKNPIEVEGVYPLPEAELDRFMAHVTVGYPDRDVELQLLSGKLHGESHPEPLHGLVDELRGALPHVTLHPDLQGYILDIVHATRDHELLDVGASPRGAVHLQDAARAHALIEGRDFVLPDDIKAMAVPVLGHRVLLSATAEVERIGADEIIADLLDQVPVPVAMQGPTDQEEE